MKKAFSLIELIVGITISMLLMASVGVFVNSWMQNIFAQQKAINNASDLNNFAQELYSTFWKISDTWSIQKTSSWVLFKISKSFDKWGFAYVWAENRPNYYCDSDSDTPNTNHAYIKTFIPYEESWENIYNNYSDILTSTITFDWEEYTAYQKENKIVDEDWNIVVWKWIFWDGFEEWSSWTWIYLNWPTWMAVNWDVLYFSDTLNNRVLYLSGWLVYSLLDEKAWLDEPTWLYYDDSENSLYIANSWSWEVLKFSSKTISVPNIDLEFTWIDEKESEIYLEFFQDWVNYNMTGNSIEVDASDLHTDNGDDEQNINWNTLTYKFKKNVNTPINNWDWTFTDDYNIEDDEVDFDETDTYTIELSNLNQFTEHWNYTIKLIIWSTEKTFYYFTQWDDKVYTKNDNKLEVYNHSLNYPTYIKDETDITDFDISSDNDIKFDEDNDTILNSPIKNLYISKNSSDDLLNIILKYYKNYNCYNEDLNEKKIRTFLSKINLR